jgi:hypothetical protein
MVYPVLRKICQLDDRTCSMNTERVGREVKLVFLQRSLLVNFIIPPIGNDFGFWILDFGFWILDCQNFAIQSMLLTHLSQLVFKLVSTSANS